MKSILWVLLKIQSGHDSVHRRTDGQGETSIPHFQPRWSGGVGGGGGGGGGWGGGVYNDENL